MTMMRQNRVDAGPLSKLSKRRRKDVYKRQYKREKKRERRERVPGGGTSGHTRRGAATREAAWAALMGTCRVHNRAACAARAAHRCAPMGMRHARHAAQEVHNGTTQRWGSARTARREREREQVR